MYNYTDFRGLCIVLTKDIIYDKISKIKKEHYEQSNIRTNTYRTS